MTLHYKVTGGDGQAYGPVSLDELEQWIGQGRVVETTAVWRSDLDRWQPAGDYLELAFVLKQARLPTLPAAQIEPENAAVRPVGFLPRFIAYMVDYFVLTAVMTALFPLLKPFGELKPTDNVMELIQQPVFWIATGVNVLVAGLFNVLFNGHFGATPGKILIGARIVNEDGSPVGYLKAAARYAAEWLSAISFGVGYLFVAFRPDRRALHDLLAGTRVVFSP
jgi:uncharacterized RDD family membrane protein YckC